MPIIMEEQQFIEMQQKGKLIELAVRIMRNLGVKKGL